MASITVSADVSAGALITDIDQLASPVLEEWILRLYSIRIWNSLKLGEYWGEIKKGTKKQRFQKIVRFSKTVVICVVPKGRVELPRGNPH